MNVERIEKLAAHLEAIPDSAFAMDEWSRVINDRPISAEHHAQNYECGMAACVGGHAALVFPDVLVFEVLPSRERPGGVYVSALLVRGADRRIQGPDAVAYLLDLCCDCAHSLTSPYSAHTERSEAVRVLRDIAAGRPYWGSCPARCEYGVTDCRAGRE